MVANSNGQLVNTRMWIAIVAIVAVAAAIVYVVRPKTVVTVTTTQPVLGAVVLDQPLADATVAFSNGAHAVTTKAGNFVVNTSLPKTFTVTVTGGTTAGQLSGITLAADYDQFNPKADEVNVDVLSTIISRYRHAHPNVSIADADASLRTALALPTDLDLTLDPVAIAPYFSAHRFISVAAQSGGFDALVTKVDNAMASGARVGTYPATATNPAGSSPASWVAGKLLEGAAGGVANAVVGNLMSQAGLDPTTNALGQISSQLAALSGQISALQSTADATLTAVLQTSFNIRMDQLPLKSIRDAESDIYKSTKETDPAMRTALRNHFESIAAAANFNLVVDKFDDLLNPATTGTMTVVQHFAKSLVGQKRFYTPLDQFQTDRVFDFLDGMQVAADTNYIEHLYIVNPTTAPGIAKIEAEQLRTQRAAQIARNPDYSGFRDTNGDYRGALDLKQRIWIRNLPQTFSQGHPGLGLNQLQLLSVPQFDSIAATRGDKTLWAYLKDDAGLTTAMVFVPEFGETGEFWTATNCDRNIGYCRLTVSTNNAYVRSVDYPRDWTGPKRYVLEYGGLTAADQARYRFLLP
jgi:hypothetical protein